MATEVSWESKEYIAWVRGRNGRRKEVVPTEGSLAGKVQEGIAACKQFEIGGRV